MSTVTVFPNQELLFKGCAHQTSYFNRLLELITSAKDSIFVMQYVFSVTDSRPWSRSNKILDAFKNAHLRGIEVLFLFDRPKERSPNFKSNVATAKKLMSFGIPVRCLSVFKTLHIKLIIFDHKVFLAGSHNITNSSLYSPFELTFECADDFLVNSSRVYFDCLWNGAFSENFSDALRSLQSGKG